MLACPAFMAVTAPTLRRPGHAADAATGEIAAAGPPDARAGAALLGALLVVLAYAAFAGGAASYPEEARLQVLLCLLAAGAVGVLLWRGGSGLPLSGSRAGWAGLGLLAAFTAWAGLSLAWSVAPSGTWAELNRAASYVLVVAIALAAASWYPRAVWHGALGYAGIALAVALYALGGKVVPGLHIGPVDFDQTDVLARLRAPLEYWNALALFLAMALPIVLRLAVDETRAARVRLGALAALPVYLVTLGLTYSRGGLIAAVVAVAVTIALAGSGLRTLMYLGLALLASAPALAIGFTADDLTGNVVPLSEREGEGLALGGVLLASIALLAVAGRLVVSAESRVASSVARTRLVVRGLLGALAVAALVGLIAMTASDRGLTGTVSHEWDSFRSSREAPAQFDPGRISSTNAGNRWVWWSEAAGAWSDRPLTGHGAGSFPVVHRQYRTDRLDVRQPHSVPLQLLAETGLVGFLLAMGGLALLFAGAVGAVRRMLPGAERGVAAALAGAAVAWLVHGFYDWDWDIPGVTMPALVFLGLLCARGSGAAWTPRSLGPGARVALLSASVLALGTVAVSAILPSWARSETDGALASVARGDSPARLERAQADADFASRLDTLAVEPLLAAASLAERRGRSDQARSYLVDAVRRQPESVQAWLALARFSLESGDLVNGRIALRKVLALDPRNRTVPLLIAVEQGTTVPANRSATATGTPLVALVGQTPATAKAFADQLRAAGQPVPPELARLAARAR
jgi:O-antigen ligase/polysaccharide polymerase Wzy-like membrane protein/tetratricopeptide repeat protein